MLPASQAVGQLSGVLERIALSEGVKVERFVLMQLDSGCIDISPARTVYLTVPARIVRELQGLGLDLVDRKRRIRWKIEASLEIEEDGEGRRHVRVSYDFSEVRGGVSL